MTVTPPDACPVCASPRASGDAFCEDCGFDFEHGEAPVAGAAVGEGVGEWQVTITADRDQFDRVATEEMVFPVGFEARVVSLESAEVTIGRSSRSRGLDPDIDLRELFEDPGVSHRHARFVRQDDGGYAVVDDGSTNGTTINDGTATIEPGVPVRLRSGDRVHVGAWTTLHVAIAFTDP